MPCIPSVQGWAVYQPLIVGLGAVVLGLIANTILEWFKQYYSRKNDARALRAALSAELTINLENLVDRMGTKNVVGPPEAATTLMVPLDSHTQVYDSSIVRLGLLTSKEITSVIKAYDSLVGGPKNFAFLGKIKGDDFYRWAEVSSKYGPTLGGLDETTTGLIKAALTDLSKAT